MPRTQIAHSRTIVGAQWMAVGAASFWAPMAWTAELPVPCVAGSCGGHAATWVGAGTATAVQSGNALTIKQTSQSAILNWHSFNISADGHVTFNQPNATSVVLNQIFQSDPSKILGALNSNGAIYLINQNGIIFGNGAQVNTGTLVASSLNITPQALNGILGAAQQNAPAFADFTDASGSPLKSGAVTVEAGATLKSPGGEIMLFGPVVSNAGTIRADGGQVILAAGDQVYLAASSDPNLRGLLVEVGTGGTATNAAASGASQGGEIAANLGDVTMVGRIVNQLGRISATTSVQENGSIRLLARDGGGVAESSSSGAVLASTTGGSLTLGSGSHTDVFLDTTDKGTAVDATVQPRSQVILNGTQVVLAGGSEVTAVSGNVSIVAAANPTAATNTYSQQPGDGRLVIDPNAAIDVSGATIQEPVSDNVIAVQLRGTELADSPLQRNGPLRGQTVYVDVRQSGTLNGKSWVGSPIGDLSGYVATIQRNVAERSLTGGSISLQSDGAVLVYPGSALNVSGGSIQFTPGYVNTTKLLGSNGLVYDISQADPSLSYVGIVNNSSVTNNKWGTTQVYPTVYSGQYQQGYVEGKDAGSINIASPALVLDGTVAASTVAGPYQRQLPTVVATGALYRPINQLPLGGQLILGLSNPANNVGGYLEPDVTFGSSDILRGLTGPGGAPFNPLADPLPSSLSTIELNPNLIGANSVSLLDIFSNGRVTIPSNVDLRFPIAGDLAIAAGAADIEGAVRAPSGTIAVTIAPTLTLQGGADSTLTLGPSAVLDASGYLVNDLPAGTTVPRTDPLAISGGNVSLSAAGGTPLNLKSGSLIDVSGGAELTSAGQVNAGAGGKIALSVGSDTNADYSAIVVESTLRGFALQNGGTLSITANRVCIADENCAGSQTSTLWAAPSLFTDDGFSKVNLTSDLGGLTLLAGTSLTPRQLNYQFTSPPASEQTGTALSAFASTVLLPEIYRAPESVTLATNVAEFAPTAQPFIGPDNMLQIGHGASIALDPGGALTVASNTSVIVDGSLSAPAGSISISTTTTLPLNAFLPNQGIWLEDGALLSTQGVALTQVNDRGLSTGSVLAGGTISVTANRGYLITTPRSSIDASGTAATLDLTPTQAVGPSLPQATQVGSAGGTINLTASEGMLLNGQVSANAGAGAGVPGGTLNVTLDGSLHADPSSGGAILPENPHQMIVSNAAPIIVAPGYDVPDVLNGFAMVPSRLINEGGFTNVALAVPNEQGPPAVNAGVVSFGSINFPQSVTLNVPGSLRLDTPQIIAGAGAQVTLSSAYVGLGYDDTRLGAQVGGGSVGGSGVLTVNADLVDFIGTLALSGLQSAVIASSGDIRLRGIETQSDTIAPLTETLQTTGTLTLQADQIYPTTLTQASVTVAGTGSTLDIRPGGTGEPVLSAGGRLALQADTILQGGVLRAPFGQLVLTADQLELEPNSVTSTSGAGQTIPFGTTQAGADWVYTLPGEQTVVYTTSGPPSKSVLLQGNSVKVDAHAIVDVSGGGDLEAYEFIPGTGGTTDVLANSFSAAQFAIVPTSGLGFAPYDPQASLGFSYAIGSSVVLGAGSGVPAGTYAILPARYALLPGAYLVTPVPGYTNLQPGQAIAQNDGSIVVAGQFKQAGTNLMQPLTQGFDVESQAQMLSRAQYTLTSANAFFSAQAAAAKTAPPDLPRDAGVLQLLAGEALQFLGTLNSAAGSGGRGGLVDISANNLEIGNATTPPAQGVVALDAAQLNALNAQSLLIGGIRSSGDPTLGATNIQTTAQTVVVDPNTKLTGSEIIVTATDGVTVGPGATLQASGAVVSVPQEYDLSGGGALLRVSTGAQTPIVRTDLDGASGAMQLAAGSMLSSPGSVTLDATGSLISGATYQVQHGSLAFSAPQISLSASAGNGAGLNLSAAQLSSLGLADLSLTSASSIDVYGANALTIDGSLTLNAALIQAASPGAAATLTGQTVALNGAAGPAVTASAGTGGALSILSSDLSLSGNISLLGFSAASLEGRSITAAAQGALEAGGPLTLRTSLLTGANGVNYQFATPGAMQVQGTGASAAPAASAGAGATLALTGSSIDIDTRIISASGSLKLTVNGPASGDGVTVGSAAMIDLSGAAVNFDGVPAAGPGGRLLASAASGSFTESAGAKIVMNAGGTGAPAGDLEISMPLGTATFSGTLSAQGAGGEISLDAQRLPDLAGLNATLNSGGFAGVRNFRQRGAGDVVLSTAGSVRASSVSIEADGGSVNIAGTIDASGTTGGSVTLAAQNAIDIEGSILASASQAGQRGGSVALYANGGELAIAGSASIDLSGGAGGSGGSLSLQVPRTTLTGMLAGGNPPIELGGHYRGVAQVQVAGLAAYDYSASGMITAADEAADPGNPLYADAAAFMQNAPAMAHTVAGQSGLNVSVIPGIEIDSTGDLTVADAWDLSGWRFGGAPGILTLRAGGNLTFQQSLSDGFNGTQGSGAFTLPSDPGTSWSYRLIGGADLSASNSMAVQSTALAAGEGNVIIAPGSIDGGATNRPPAPVMIRTGTGDIDIAAAADLQFGNRASVVYTAGEASGLGIPLAGLQNLAYPTSGGDIAVHVGGDILGAPTNQLVTSWLWRTGQAPGSRSPGPTGWTVDYQFFEENIGALGGGNIKISAGGDVSELSVAIPNIGVQVGGTSAEANSVQVTGGGTLNVESGGDITGGSYFVGTGSGGLFARGAIGADLSGRATATGNAPILALGDAVLSASAIGDVSIEGALNPMLLIQGRVQPIPHGGSFFSTYSNNSAVNLQSAAGDVTLIDDPTRAGGPVSQLTSMFLNSGDSTQPFSLFPGTLNATALAGSVIVGGQGFTLWPAPRGNLNLLAQQNVVFSSTSGAALLMSDIDPASLPSPDAPVSTLASNAAWGGIFGAPPPGIANVPVHSASFGASGSEDPVPVRIVAASGNISDADLIFVPKPIHLIAGKNITGLYLQDQQLSPSDQSIISAGGNLSYAPIRDSNSGALLSDNGHGIVIEGPGSLGVSAGGNIDLGTSLGITTAGNLYNPALPATGASVSLLAGATVADADIANFTKTYLTSNSTYDTELIAFVESQTGSSVATKAQALTLLASLNSEQQLEFCEQVMYQEIRVGGEAAAAAGPLHDNYTRSFTALATLFPGSTSSDPKTGATVKYPGNISMYFSRVYTLDGGDVSLLAPGGFVNVGISTPPAAFGVTKSPDQLGLVAQGTGNIASVSFGDFEVNESRVFAANGGDILVWSTDGNIDAGRGAKTAISAPSPTITFDSSGHIETVFPAALTGSGIQALATSAGTTPGNVDLFAPQGVVNANDAGIVAGNLTIGATAVLGRDNITVSGVAVGLPVDTSGLGAGLTGASAAASSATNAATLGVNPASAAEKAAPLADTALNWLDVFVTGLGEENCKPDDNECLKRQKLK
jgi:filamentous hemagglutinin